MRLASLRAALSAHSLPALLEVNMAVTSVNIVLNPGVYTEVANGQPCCYIAIKSRQVVRVYLGPAATVPDPDELSYFMIEATGEEFARLWGGFENLAATDGIWLRLNTDIMDSVCVISGDVKFSGR
jgi:hypothetical protein